MDASSPRDGGIDGVADDGGAADAAAGDGVTLLEGEANDDSFGDSVALSADGSRLVVGARLNDGTATNAGHARIFERQDNEWVQLGADIDGEAANDRFGGSVAISDDGNRVAIGSYLNDGGGTSSGHVRVFDWADAAWAQVGADIDGPAGRGSGWAVALSASGHRVVIGGPGDGSQNGVVHVFEEADGEWEPIGTPIEGGAELGHAVAISDDGDRMALSFPSASGSSLPGTTQVYDWTGSAWEQAGADIAGEEIGDFAGSALSMSADGATLAIGASSNHGVDVGGGGAAGGHIRVYSWADEEWVQLGSDLDGDSGTALGTAVALSADGTHLVGGAPAGGGARYYVLEGGDWVERAIANETTARAGTSVAISADGSSCAVGAIYHLSQRGAVRVFNLP